MGCICSKGFSANEHILKQPNKSPRHLFSSTLERDNVATVLDNGNNGATARFISQGTDERHNREKEHGVYDKSDLQSSQRPNKIHIEGNVTIYQHGLYRIFSIKNRLQQTWLNVVVGDAIKGCLPLRADSFYNMYKVCKHPILCHLHQINFPKFLLFMYRYAWQWIGS